MMASKRYGILVTGALLAGALGAAGYGYYAYEEKIMRATRVELPPLPRIPPIPPDAMAEMERVQPRLARLGIPTEGPPGAVDLGLFGYQPAVRPQRVAGAASASPTPEDFPQHVVAMAFVSPGLAFCVVDGTLRRPGDELADGTRILHIAPGRVLLEWEGITEWFDVSNPARETEAADS